MLELYVTIALSILNIVLPYVIVRFDRARLAPEQRARAWNLPSFACAIYFFGPLSLPAHFWVTRRKPLAVLGGILLMVAVFGAEWALGSLLEEALT
jgi:hypothetical protein